MHLGETTWEQKTHSKVNDKDARIIHVICLKVPEDWKFNVLNFEHIILIVVLISLLTVNRLLPQGNLS